MPISETAADYRMADIRRLFPNVSDTIIDKWNSKGLLACQKRPDTIRTTIRYTSLGLVHIKVLRELSTYGILQYYGDVIAATSTGIITLTQPERLVAYYRDHGPDLKILVTATEMPMPSTRDRRMRRTRTQFVMAFATDYMTYLDARGDHPEDLSTLIIDLGGIVRKVYDGLGLSWLL